LKFAFGGVATGKAASDVEGDPEALSVFFDRVAHFFVG